MTVTEFTFGVLWRIPMICGLLALGEWAAHKYVLHKKWKRLLGFSYRQHHVEHHGMGQNKIRPHIHLSWVDYLWTLPAVGWQIFQVTYLDFPGGYCGMVALALCCVGHMYFWNTLHRAIHDLEENWTSRQPWFNYFKQHHLDHHRKPNSNYGVVFPWIDNLMGTKYHA